jgi:hypothetical protein
MSDLVERLWAESIADWDKTLCREAADEIERLREALAKERERCAQVAEQQCPSCFDVAAAIRALKDEPQDTE